MTFFRSWRPSALVVAVTCGVASALCSSCFNDDYDLSDVDTHAKIPVNQLTVPLQMDGVRLETVLDLDDASCIKRLDNGDYAVLKEGTYSSDPIRVDGFTTRTEAIAPITDRLPLTVTYGRGKTGGVSGKTRGAGAEEIAYAEISDDTRSFDMRSDAVSEHIRSIEAVTVDGVMEFTLRFSGVPAAFDSYELTDFRVQLPRGMAGEPSAGRYDSATGVLTVDRLDGVRVGQNLESRLTFALSDIDVEALGGTLQGGHFAATARLHVLGGRLALTTEDLRGGADVASAVQGLPEGVSYTCVPRVAPLHVLSFTGLLAYDVEGLAVEPIDINDLPDVLTQSGTDIALENPQIYLSLTNPLASERVHGRAGLTLTPVRGGAAGTPTSLDEGEAIRLQPGLSDNVFCLSPVRPEAYYRGYESAAHVPFGGLSTVMSGEGLPTSICIDITDPAMPEQHVSGFAVGQMRGGSYVAVERQAVEGRYEFVAPLTLTPSSRVVYSDSDFGWGDEDVYALTIDRISLTATITSTFPADLQLEATPLVVDDAAREADVVEVNGDGHKLVYARDAAGNVIRGRAYMAGEDGTAGSDILTTSQGGPQPIVIVIDGPVTKLDGIVYTARVLRANGQTLRPDNDIRLDQIRATVTGCYEKEL